jgi:hypothetical protein
MVVNVFTEISKPRKRGRPPGMNADGQAVRKVSYGAGVTFADGTVRQILSLDPQQRRQMRRLVLGSAEPYQVGVLHNRVEHHESLDGVVPPPVRPRLAAAAPGRRELLPLFERLPESFATECPSLSTMLAVIGQIEVMRCFTARTWVPRRAGRG